MLEGPFLDSDLIAETVGICIRISLVLFLVKGANLRRNESFSSVFFYQVFVSILRTRPQLGTRRYQASYSRFRRLPLSPTTIHTYACKKTKQKKDQEQEQEEEE
jgi:hypothetical protein